MIGRRGFFAALAGLFGLAATSDRAPTFRYDIKVSDNVSPDSYARVFAGIESRFAEHNERLSKSGKRDQAPIIFTVNGVTVPIQEIHANTNLCGAGIHVKSKPGAIAAREGDRVNLDILWGNFRYQGTATAKQVFALGEIERHGFVCGDDFRCLGRVEV